MPLPPFARKTVSEIKQTFEQSKNNSLPYNHQFASKQNPHSSGGTATDMPPRKAALAKLKNNFQPSINAVLDTASNIMSSASQRPATSKHPSWIGPTPPERVPTPGTMRNGHPVIIQFSCPGLQPPVFVSTSLSEPPWVPIEMENEKGKEDVYTFWMKFEAEVGEYQYKLRLGPGDWWICDDSQPKVEDDAGNENNLVEVKPHCKASSSEVSLPVSAEASPPTHIPNIQGPDDDLSDDRRDSVHNAPRMAHEIASLEKEAPVHRRDECEALAEPENQSPLFRHESLGLEPTNEDERNDDDDERESPPLLRHEAIVPSSQEQDQSSLLPHEGIGIDDKQYSDLHQQPSPVMIRRQSSSDLMPEEADPNDPSLEKFPTDHKGIMEHIARTRRSLQEDDASEGHPSPRRNSPTGSVITTASPSLPSVQEDDGEREPANLPGRKEQTAKIEKVDPDVDVSHVTISEPLDVTAEPVTSLTADDETDQARVVEVRRAEKKARKSKGALFSETQFFGTIYVFAMVVAVGSALWWYQAASDSYYDHVVE